MILNERSASTPPHRFELAYSHARPVRYQHPELRQSIGDLIGRAHEDDVLAAFLLQAEARTTRIAIDEITQWDTLITKEIRDLTEQLQEGDYRPSLQWEGERLLRDAIERYQRELQIIQAARAAAEDAFTHLKDTYGQEPGQALADGDRPAAADSVMMHRCTAEAAWDRANQDRTEIDARAAALVKASKRRQAFYNSGAGCTPQELHHLDGASLERLVAQLLARDGLDLVRAAGGPGDQGADVIAVCPRGRRFVFQSKYRQHRPVDPEVVYVLNGTARDLHDADVAVVCTNSTFTNQATKDAAKVGVHLIHGEQLSLWATWGDTIYQVLALDHPADPPKVAA